MKNFKRLFISAFSICMIVPLDNLDFIYRSFLAQNWPEMDQNLAPVEILVFFSNHIFFSIIFFCRSF